ncbi:MAG: alpha/beta hydrolase [Anaerobacillus sp.]
MKTLTYTRLLNETISIYDESGSLKAYQYMKENADQVDGNEAQLYNFKYALAAASGLEEVALSEMKEAVMDHGYWYAYDYLESDEDLNAIRKYDDFKEMVQICKRREEEAMLASIPELIVVDTKQDSDQIIVALHGDQENAEMTSRSWQRASTKGYTLAFPQSSQIQFSDAYEWEDVDKGVEELAHHVQNLKEQKNLLGNDMILAGFSAGCRVALKALIDNRVSIDGFIFVAPWLPEIEEWSPLLAPLKENGLKGYIMCGDQDEDCLEGSKKLSETLTSNEIPHELKIIKNLDHEYPEEFNEWLHRALKYLNT